MKAIIFGITGQDGSHLSDLLLSKNYEVVGVSRYVSVDTTSRLKHILDHPNFTLVNGDLIDVSSIQRVFREHPETTEVYNLAAQSHVAVSFKQPGLTWDVTGKGCLNILQTIVDMGLEKHVRFYQASSSEMFGKSYDVKPPSPQHAILFQGLWVDGDGQNYEDQLGRVDKFQDENTRFLPQSPYAIAKCAAHNAVRVYREGYGIHASAGILFNHEGPRRGERFVTRKITKWIGDFITWLGDNFPDKDCLQSCSLLEVDDLVFVDGSKTKTFPKLRLGNLDAFRDWGYAGDYVEAMWMMLQQEKPDDYVICTGETHTIREFLDHAFARVGIEDWSGLVVIDPKFYRPAEVDFLRGDAAKAKEVLGWTPSHSFEDLVNMMVDHDIEVARG